MPAQALDARSLLGNSFNLGCGLLLALGGVLLAFGAVPAADLGPTHPEAAWAFFWARSTATTVALSCKQSPGIGSFALVPVGSQHWLGASAATPAWSVVG